MTRSVSVAVRITPELRDWTDAEYAGQRSAAIRRLLQEAYRSKYPPDKPIPAEDLLRKALELLRVGVRQDGKLNLDTSMEVLEMLNTAIHEILQETDKTLAPVQD